uniref:Putative tick salivary cystatin n=1 Tax=Rhipicephalus pulchellus TaxID=72859 RepID=L7LTK0_RHIPC
MLPMDMAAIKPSCLLVLLGVWVGLFLGSCYVESVMMEGWVEQKPDGSPVYLKLAHYAVSTQIGRRTVYDAVVKLTYVAKQVDRGTNYKLTFLAAPSKCKIGQAYSAKKCSPAGPANKKCAAIAHVGTAANLKKVLSYTCVILKG